MANKKAPPPPPSPVKPDPALMGMPPGTDLSTHGGGPPVLPEPAVQEPEPLNIEQVEAAFLAMSEADQQILFLTLSERVKFEDGQVEEYLQHEVREHAVNDELPPAGWLQLVIAGIITKNMDMSTDAIITHYRNYVAGKNEAKQTQIRMQIKQACTSITQTIQIVKNALNL